MRRDLGYSYEAARRYIEFSHVVGRYNRLLASGQTYTTLTGYLRDIEAQADSDPDFGALLKNRLRDITVGGQVIQMAQLEAAFGQLAIVAPPPTKEMKIVKRKAATDNELPSTSRDNAMDDNDAATKAKVRGEEAAANNDNDEFGSAEEE